MSLYSSGNSNFEEFWNYHQGGLSGWMMNGHPSWISSTPQEMVCTICSDKAEGYHFGAISCAACGAFFRRSVSDQKVYSCFNRQCNITHDPTKRGGSCRYCRFLKCVSSGMAPQDVKAKRTSSSSQTGPSLYRNMNPSSILLIDQIIVFRRSILAERPMFEAISVTTNRTNLMICLHQELEMLRRTLSGSPLFMQITDHLNYQNDGSELKLMEDPIRSLLLVVFVFETCYLTATKGGVQLDRLFFPNMVHVDLSEHSFLEFLQCDHQTRLDSHRTVHNSFSFLVQMVSRTFQSSNFDEPFLAILLYKVLTESVPLNFRHRFAEINRDCLLTDLNRVDSTAFDQISNLSTQLHQGSRAFRETISNF